jgi:hypothetical protein
LRSKTGRSPGRRRVPRLLSARLVRRGLPLERRYQTEPAGASARCASLRGPHPQPPPSIFVAGAKDWFAQQNRPQPRPAARTKAPFSAARTARSAVGTSVPDRTSRGFGCCASLRTLIPSHLLRSSWLGLRTGLRSKTGRSPGPRRVPRLPQRGSYGAVCRWNVGTRPNQPGLRGAALRCAPLIPSHLLRSSWLGLRPGLRSKTGHSPGRRRVPRLLLSAARTARSAVGTSVPAGTEPGLRGASLRCAPLIPSHLLRFTLFFRDPCLSRPESLLL